ncbi:MAG TPA: hypothetical protein VFV14_09025 [Myxococcaceae bacterium]|nr:hypothetical protein [Myxococcaceae bacterium]
MQPQQSSKMLSRTSHVQARIQAKPPPGTVFEAIAAMAGRGGLMRFAALDHGSILRLQGRSARQLDEKFAALVDAVAGAGENVS